MVLGVDSVSFRLIYNAAFVEKVVTIFERQYLLILVSIIFSRTGGLGKIITLALRVVEGWTLGLSIRLVVLFSHTLRLGVLDCVCGAKLEVFVLKPVLVLLMILLHLRILLVSHHRLRKYGLLLLLQLLPLLLLLLMSLVSHKCWLSLEMRARWAALTLITDEGSYNSLRPIAYLYLIIIDIALVVHKHIHRFLLLCLLLLLWMHLVV